MRIISGKYKSRQLISPGKDDRVRPTTDRAKESLFNLIINFFDPEGSKVIDMFCGSGSIGLEFISRGADRSIFIDKDIIAVSKNVKALGVEDKCLIVKHCCLDYIRYPISTDLIFADPPYNYEDLNELITLASAQDCYFILEHSGDLVLTNEIKEKVIKEKKIGITNFTFFDFRILPEN